MSAGPRALHEGCVYHHLRDGVEQEAADVGSHIVSIKADWISGRKFGSSASTRNAGQRTNPLRLRENNSHPEFFTHLKTSRVTLASPLLPLLEAVTSNELQLPDTTVGPRTDSADGGLLHSASSRLYVLASMHVGTLHYIWHLRIHRPTGAYARSEFYEVRQSLVPLDECIWSELLGSLCNFDQSPLSLRTAPLGVTSPFL